MYFLEDEMIGLRNLVSGDIEQGYCDWLNDPEVCRYNSHHRFPMTVGSLEDFVSGANRGNTSIVFAVDEKETGRHIGNISLQSIDYINRQAEIAFLFGEKEMWGKGYATRAAKLLINQAFMELGLNRIYFGTAEDNIGMQRVGEKLNFKVGGILRQALYKHGRYVNIVQFDLLREEWED